jgi:stage IV sporulation protein B
MIELTGMGIGMRGIKGKKYGRGMKIYRYSLCVLLAVAMVFSLGLGLYMFDGSVPSVLYARSGQDISFSLGVPAKAQVIKTGVQGESNIPEGAVTIDLSKEVTLPDEGLDYYSFQVSLFGIFPIKQMDIRVVDETELIPVGAPVGIYMETDGIMVIGTGEFKDAEGLQCSPAKYILKSGDYIMRVNGTNVSSKKEFVDMVTDNGGSDMILTIKRNDETINVTVTPHMDEAGVYKLGLWVRDNTQGVGTLTYIDPDGNFGALGHGITDIDTDSVMEITDGTLYDTEIISVKKGEAGEPGEMTGLITYSDNHILGDITENTDDGIFGVCNEKALKEFSGSQALPIAFKQEIQKGAAQIISTVDSQTKYYDIEITDINFEHDNVNRGIELKVTDQELIEKTGGIVQGMSGSPIIQNGKIVGAVTHVFVNDPTRGYGIFIENMLEH